jgi:hypothetical protein
MKDRAPGRFQMCQWDVRDPEPVVTANATAAVGPVVPLPPPRPKFDSNNRLKPAS